MKARIDLRFKVRAMTPKEHALAIVDNYNSHRLGDPTTSDDHAVATAVAYLALYQKHEHVAGVTLYETSKIVDHCGDQHGWRLTTIKKSAERIESAFM